MRNIFTFLLLLSLLASIRGKHKEKANKKNDLKQDNLSNNLNTTLDESHNEEEIANNEEGNDTETASDKASGMYDPRNQRRILKMDARLECVMCYANGTSKSDDECYKGTSASTQSCAENDAACYTKLHPKFIRRGCLVPKHVNVTFVCKCPLCNDKTSKDLSYYTYTSLIDWEYDNQRLSEQVSGADLLCKVCETKGLNPSEDQTCALGRNSDYMHCGHRQMCFTNINPQMGFGESVTRGCIDMPVYNSYFMFCNRTKCNNEEFPNFRRKRQHFVFRTVPMVKSATSVGNIMVLHKYLWILFFSIRFK